MLFAPLLSLALLAAPAAAPAPAARPPEAKPADAPKPKPSPVPERKAPAEAFDAAKPLTWRLDAKLKRDGKEREALVKELTAKATGPDDAALTVAEADALLDDPRAQPVYGEKTVAIVAPSMIRVQREQHRDLLKIFLTPENLARAREFHLNHAKELSGAMEKHKVDSTAIVSILMWETRLGTITGDYYAFNAFTSQAFFVDEANAVALGAPSEAKDLAQVSPEQQKARVERIRERARRNLVVLVRMSKARGLDPLEVKGSWAGALGFPQFMPASLRWADDGDGDGKVDLHTFPDAIYSVGRYLGDHGYAKDRRQAVWSYNHEDAYVSGVLAFADALKTQLEAVAAPKDPRDAGTDAAGR